MRTPMTWRLEKGCLILKVVDRCPLRPGCFSCLSPMDALAPCAQVQPAARLNTCSQYAPTDAQRHTHTYTHSHTHRGPHRPAETARCLSQPPDLRGHDQRRQPRTLPPFHLTVTEARWWYIHTPSLSGFTGTHIHGLKSIWYPCPDPRPLTSTSAQTLGLYKGWCPPAVSSPTWKVASEHVQKCTHIENRVQDDTENRKRI